MDRSKFSGNSGSTGSPGSNFGQTSTASGLITGDAGQAIRGAGQTVQDTVGQALDQVQQQAKNQISSGKDLFSDTLGSVAQFLHQTSGQLRDEHQEPIAQFVDRAASEFESFSTHLHQENVDQLVGDVERFARRQPMLFVGGAFALGLFAARLLKSGPAGNDLDHDRLAPFTGAAPSPTLGSFGRGDVDLSYNYTDSSFPNGTDEGLGTFNAPTRSY